MRERKKNDEKGIPLDYAGPTVPIAAHLPTRTEIWLVYGAACLCGIFLNGFLPIGTPGGGAPLTLWIRARNTFRAEAGPFGLGISLLGGEHVNDLWAAVVAFIVSTISLLFLIWFSPLRRARLAVHLSFAFIWFCSGFCCNG
jgi:hypothetical protein